MHWKTCPYSDRRHFVPSFISALEGLATQSKAQMKINFIEVETAVKTKLLLSWNNSTKDTAKENESLILATTTSISTTLRKRRCCLLSSSKYRKINWLIWRNTLSAILTRCQFLVLAVQNMISTWSSRICCQILLTNDKVNQQLSKKLICLFLSSLVICSYLIMWIFLVEPLLLTPCTNNEELLPYDCFLQAA